MKNNKGFTLVEVLAVITILTAILVIITPKIIKSYQNSKDIIYDEQINAIIEASKLYTSRHVSVLPDNGNYVITLDELKSDGLIKNKQVLNPKNKQPLTGCVVVSFQNNKYKYEYTEDDICNK